MSNQLIVTTTTAQSSVTLIANPSAHPAIQALSVTEQMNQQVIGEMTTTLKTFEKLLTDMQKTLDATTKENALLKKEIVQLNTTIKENERLHAAETKKNTQANATLSQTVKNLTSDLSSIDYRLTEQEKSAAKFKDHYHTTALNFQGGYRTTNYSSSGPVTR